MPKRKKADPLIQAVERALDPGRFVPYGASWEFVQRLEGVKRELDDLVKAGEAERAVHLYQLFLTGCYEKVEELDDSGGDLAQFFADLLVSWIKARQKAGCQPEETVKQILMWVKNDGYGFCYGIEGDVAKALDKGGGRLFCQHFADRFEEAFAPLATEEPMRISAFPAATQTAAEPLKAIYVARRSLGPYLALCERTPPSPKDCANIGEILIAKRRPADALEWVEKGLALASAGSWGRENSYALATMQRNLLKRLGRKSEACELAWLAFQEHPSLLGYRELMTCVPRKDGRRWRKQALQHAERSSISAFLEIGVEQKAWDALGHRIMGVSNEALEGVSHFVNEPAAKGLARRHPLAAAKIHRALAMRIVTAAKSKYYAYALEHFQRAKELYEKNGREDSWQALVAIVRKDHHRKHSLIGGFEAIAAGQPTHRPRSFEQRMRAKWQKQVSN